MIARIQATKGQTIDAYMAAILSMIVHDFPLVHWVSKVPTSSRSSTLFLQYGCSIPCMVFNVTYTNFEGPKLDA